MMVSGAKAGKEWKGRAKASEKQNEGGEEESDDNGIILSGDIKYFIGMEGGGGREKQKHLRSKRKEQSDESSLMTLELYCEEQWKEECESMTIFF